MKQKKVKNRKWFGKRGGAKQDWVLWATDRMVVFFLRGMRSHRRALSAEQTTAQLW